MVLRSAFTFELSKQVCATIIGPESSHSQKERWQNYTGILITYVQTLQEIRPRLPIPDHGVNQGRAHPHYGTALSLRMLALPIRRESVSSTVRQLRMFDTNHLPRSDRLLNPHHWPLHNWPTRILSGQGEILRFHNLKIRVIHLSAFHHLYPTR